MALWLGGALIQWACSVAVSLPFAWIAIRTLKQQDLPNALWCLVQIYVFFFISLALTRLNQVGTGIRSPWQAMILEATWAIIFLIMTKSVSRAGLTVKTNRKGWRDGLVISGILLLFVFVRGLALNFTGLGPSSSGKTGLEYILYTLLMPGIAEELTYRGVIQSALNMEIKRPWKLFEAEVGWGWIIASLLFWAPHAFQVDAGMHLTFYWPTLSLQLIVGFALGWLYERTQNLFLPIIAHNLVNVTRLLV